MKTSRSSVKHSTAMDPSDAVVEFRLPPDRIFLIKQPVRCHVVFKVKDFNVSARDWIGLFVAPYQSSSSYVTFEWVASASEATGDDSDDEGGFLLHALLAESNLNVCLWNDQGTVCIVCVTASCQSLARPVKCVWRV